MWTSFDLLRMCYVLLFWTSLKDVAREHEKKREAIPVASRRYHQKRKERNKSGISGCGLFVVAYFQPATSIDLLHRHCSNLKQTRANVLKCSVQSLFFFFFFLFLCARQPPSDEQKTARRFCCTFAGSAESYKVV